MSSEKALTSLVWGEGGNLTFLGEVVTTDPFAVAAAAAVLVLVEAVEFFLVLFLDCLRTEFRSKLCLRKGPSSVLPPPPLDKPEMSPFSLVSLEFTGNGAADDLLTSPFI